MSREVQGSDRVLPSLSTEEGLRMPTEEELMIDLIAQTNGGDIEPARAWFFEEPLEELGGDTAANYVTRGKGDAIRHYVLNLGAGATG